MGADSERAREELEEAMAKAAGGAVDEAARSWIRDVCVRAATEDRRCPGALPELLKSLAAVFVAVTTQRQQAEAEAEAAAAARERESAAEAWRSMPCVCPCGSRLFLVEGDCLLCDGRGEISRQLMDAYLKTPAARAKHDVPVRRDVDESYGVQCYCCGEALARRDLEAHLLTCAGAATAKRALPLLAAPDGARRLSEVRLRPTRQDDVHADKWAVPRRLAAPGSPTSVLRIDAPKLPTTASAAAKLPSPAAKPAKKARRAGKKHKSRVRARA